MIEFKLDKIKEDHNIHESITALADGNPGALAVLFELFTKFHETDDTIPFTIMVLLDTLTIHGDKIWILYKDVCDEDINQVIIMMTAAQIEAISKDEIHTWIDNSEVDSERMFEAALEVLKVSTSAE